MRMLKERGHDVLVVSRKKDVAVDLLDRFGIEHQPISTAGKGTLGLARELILRDIALWRIARKYRPDIMTGFGGVAISHIGKLLGIPSVAFYDTETATIQNRVAYPFLTELHVPRWYSGPVPEGRTKRFNGFKELSYFHPDRFTPDHDLAVQSGLDPERDNYFIRIVRWGANHDIGKAGWSIDLLSQVVDRLSPMGKVHISTETPLPEQFDPHIYAGSVTEVHHVLAFCRLYAGESATMCTEGAVLGVPGIFSAPYSISYVRELASTGMVVNIESVDQDRIIAALDDILSRSTEKWAEIHRNMMAEKDDTAVYITSTLESWGEGRNNGVVGENRGRTG